MKKITKVFISALFFLPAIAFSELHKPNRIVELGLDWEAGASNSYASTSELLVKDLVIDLQKMEKDVSKSGWNIETFARESTFLNINANEKFRLGFYAGVEATGNINIGHELFELLGSGYSVGESKTMSIDTRADVFVDTGISFRTKIAGFGVKISPSYYIPIVYVPKTSTKISWSTNEDGEIRASAEADLNVYTAFDLARVFEGEDDLNEDGTQKFTDDLETASQVQDALKNGGFDLALEVEHPIFGNILEVGGFLRVPILPGKLNYKANRKMTFEFYQSNFLGKLNDESETENDHDTGEFTYFKETKKVYRPLKFGAEAIYRPFGWLDVRPMFDIVMRSPYSNEMVVYPEYSLDATIHCKNIVGFTLGTSYLDQTFNQRVGFFVNARVIELDTMISFRSGSFVKSFMGAGVAAYFGLKMGF